MRKLILVVHTSLDGFVAGSKGELDGFEAGEENLKFVCKITKDADSAIFGRISYELLESYWPTAKDQPEATEGEILYSEWYNGVKKIVFSTTMTGECTDNMIILNDKISTEIKKIKEQAGKDILIFGSPSVAQTLMKLDLIDSYWIFINPVFFGRGIPLFSGKAEKSKLKLMATQHFANGEIALNYVVERQ
jgi:dihydrofolate reductase